MSGTTNKKLVLSGEPSVQLLPPMVRERAKVRESRRIMVLLMVLAVVVVAGGVTFAFTQSVASQVALADAQAKTDALLAEQLTYAEAAAVADLVEATKAAQLVVTATEADWASIYSEVSRRLASESSIDAGVIAAPAPWDGIVATTTDIDNVDGLISVSVVVQSKKIITAAEIADRLHTMTGYASSWIASTEYDDGDHVYMTSVVVTLNAEALTHRFAETTDEESADGDATEETEETDGSEDPSAEPTEEATP
ncbi:hypothetical protein [uncultured Schumannella sp.]|uniref:hypothetical protein n=1 Tax=uncultured Schumannella sp. TaxID=1195956 RepID=UPI0025F1D1F4|nr:hypothetical protein [uncultured Schumannella sp.]